MTCWRRFVVGCVVAGLAVPIAASGPAVAAPQLRVPSNRTPTIQSALDVAKEGSRITVAPGHYTENLNFSGKNVEVVSKAGAETTVIDGGSAGPVVSFTTGEGPGAVLRGFTITGGEAGSASSYTGGGIYIKGSSPSILDNTITGNGGCFGAGIGISGSGAATIRNNVIDGNLSPVNSNCTGGGLFVGFTFDAAPAVTGNLISNNIADNGAGMGMNAGGRTLISDNVFAGNRATYDGGAIFQLNTSLPSIVQNLIVDNTAGEGSALYLSGNASGFDLVNNTIAGNRPESPYATGLGATIYQQAGRANYYNNVVDAPAGKLVMRCGNIFGADQAKTRSNDLYAPGGTASEGTCSVTIGTNGNISSDPLLTADRRLGAGSPAIDAGYSLAPLLPTKDLDGNTRIAGAAVDMGAYESV